MANDCTEYLRKRQTRYVAPHAVPERRRLSDWYKHAWDGFYYDEEEVTIAIDDYCRAKAGQPFIAAPHDVTADGPDLVEPQTIASLAAARREFLASVNVDLDYGDLPAIDPSEG